MTDILDLIEKYPALGEQIKHLSMEYSNQDEALHALYKQQIDALWANYQQDVRAAIADYDNLEG